MTYFQFKTTYSVRLNPQQEAANFSRDFFMVIDLLLDKIKDRLPTVFGKRSSVTVFGFNLAEKVQARSGWIFPARAQG